MKMSEYGQVKEIFSEYVQVKINERLSTEITKDDIEFFLEQFLDSKNVLFFVGSVPFRTADNKHPETGEKAFDMAGRSYKDLASELRPVLEKMVQETYGRLSETTNPFYYNPVPKTLDDYALDNALASGLTQQEWDDLSHEERTRHPAFRKATLESQKVKSRIQVYFKKVLPLMLRLTMHHPISIGRYSTGLSSGSGGPLPVARKSSNGNFVTIDSEEELQYFLNNSRFPPGDSQFPAARDSSLRYMWWNPTTTGKNIKVSVIDCDNPAKLGRKETKDIITKIVKRLDSLGHPNIIMHTGYSYQIWVGKKEGQPDWDMRESEDYFRRILTEYGHYGQNSAKELAIANDTMHFDSRTFQKDQPIRMFFSLHYPSQQATGAKSWTGLSAIPLTLGDLRNFDQNQHSHPENVIANFDNLARLVTDFFDTVEVGQDYESEGDLETPARAERVEGKHDSYPKLKAITDIYQYTKVKPEQIVEKIGKEEKVFATTMARGVDAVLEYRHKGGFKFNGKLLKENKTIAGTATIDPTRAILVTRTGIVIHSDYITRDIERYCESEGRRELTLVGQVVMKDSVGVDAEETDILSYLLDPDTDSVSAKKFHFVANFISSIDGGEVPMEKMEEELLKVNTKRTTPSPMFTLPSPVGRVLKETYKKLRETRKGSRMIVMGKENYLVSGKNTINMAVIGIDDTSDAYLKDSPDDIGPVYVALLKRGGRNKSPLYYLMAKASIALKGKERGRLKELLRGEDVSYVNEKTGELVQRYENVVPIPAEKKRQNQINMEMVEPKVVVEVEYDDISDIMNIVVPFRYTTLAKRDRSFIFDDTVKTQRFGNKLLGARVVKIQDNLNAERLSDVGPQQDPLIYIGSKRYGPNRLEVPMILPNPWYSKWYSLDEYKNARLSEEPNSVEPWRLTPKTYKKFRRLAKKMDLVGFVKKKRMYYNENDGWATFGDDEEMVNANFSFISIRQPFRLRGVDVINYTKLCVNFGINWHMVIDEDRFWWVYCELEDDSLKLRRNDVLAGESDDNLNEVMASLLSAIANNYPPKKEVVSPDTIPGFKFHVVSVENIEVKRNPAFFGVQSKLNAGPDAMYHTILDAEPTPDGEPRRVLLKGGGYMDVHYYGGKRAFPPLFSGPQSGPEPEFKKAYERFNKADKGLLDPNDDGYKLFVDRNTLVYGNNVPYYAVTSLPPQFQNAVDDTRGYGQDGTRVVTMDGTLKQPKFYSEQADSEVVKNLDQEKEDLKVVMATMNRVPGGDKPPNVNTWTRTDANYVERMKELNEKEKASLTPVPFNHMKSLSEEVISNPIVKQDLWDEMVSKYEYEYDQWERMTEAKEPWERYSKGVFPQWATGLLEKERQMREARKKFLLTEDEETIINATLGGRIEGGVLESTLGDMYQEVDEEDVESEEYDPSEEQEDTE